MPSPPTSFDAAAAVASNRFWYHAMELAPGVQTPGWFDLRPIVNRLPWPDLVGKRCLEVGPYDGYLSFEMERRGAAEVIAADIGSPHEWDWPLGKRRSGPATITAISGERTGGGFEIAKRLLGSGAERVELSAYELNPERVGRFDFVICGSLALHLRDPVGALEAIRGVTAGDGRFLSAETISVGLTSAYRRPAAKLRGGELCQWWIPNRAGHKLMLEAAGFEIEQTIRPYAIPFGPGHPGRSSRLGASLKDLLSAPLIGGVGVPHSAALCRPATIVG